MKPAFAAFAVTVTLLTIVAAVAGAQVQGERVFAIHFALGLMATLFTCLCHCVVLIYFMATGKMIRLAVEDAALDVSLAEAAQRFKIKVYAVLMPAIVLALLAAFSGGWATMNDRRATVHLLAAIASILVQLLAFYREFTLIALNGRLMDDVFARHEASRRAGGR